MTSERIKKLLPELTNGLTYEELKETCQNADKEYHSYFVNGVKLPFIVAPSNLEAIKSFEIRDDDVFVLTYPRSGTHWITEIVSRILSGGKDDFDRTYMKTNLEMCYTADPSKVDSTQPGYKLFAECQSPRCMNSHLPSCLLPPHITANAKVVYVARNPKDTLVSLLKVSQVTTVPPFTNFDVFLWLQYTGEYVYGSWFDHVLSYWRRRDEPNILFLKYEDLQKDLRGSIRKVAEHIGKELSEDVIDNIAEHTSIGEMRKTYEKLGDKYGEADARQMTRIFGGQTSYLGKGKVGGWKNSFTVAQSALFDKIYALKIEGSGLEFDFE